MKVKHLLKREKVEEYNHAKLLKEILMTNFLIITVYEVIGKTLSTLFYNGYQNYHDEQLPA